jgi:sodium/hydrogen antiporter
VHEVLSFGKTLERLLEVMLVVLVGIAVSRHWDARAVLIAATLFVVIRPAFSWLALAGTPTSHWQRWLMGWFGIRGIGSLYYLTYALNHAQIEQREALVAITVSVVALSILVHGATAQPLLDHYEKILRRRKVGGARRESA